MRKPHVHVTQEAILEALLETGGGFLPDIAEYFRVSEGTVRRNCDGLVYQGKLTVEPGHGRVPRYYGTVEAVAHAGG